MWIFTERFEHLIELMACLLVLKHLFFSSMLHFYPSELHVMMYWESENKEGIHWIAPEDADYHMLYLSVWRNQMIYIFVDT